MSTVAPSDAKASGNRRATPKLITLAALTLLLIGVAVALPLALLTGESDNSGDTTSYCLEFPSSILCRPGPPPQHPPSPPPYTLVSFGVVASGTVDDYGDAEKAAIAQVVATKTGVDDLTIVWNDTLLVCVWGVRVGVRVGVRIGVCVGGAG